MTNRNDPCFFGNDDHDGIAFFAKAERRAMPQAERAIQIGPLRDGKNARGGNDAIIPDDHAAIVQRRLRKENADREFGGKRAIHLHAALGDGLDVLPALEGDQGAELAVREIEGHGADQFQRLAAVLGIGREENPGARQGRLETAAQFWLEDDDGAR